MVCSSVNVLVGFGGSSIPAGAVSVLHVGSATSSAAAFSAFSFLAFDVDLFVDFFGFFGVQIFSTSAGSSSGGARATDAISAAVGLTSPESTFWRVPGTASSAASTPLAYSSASLT